MINRLITSNWSSMASTNSRCSFEGLVSTSILLPKVKYAGTRSHIAADNYSYIRRLRYCVLSMKSNFIGSAMSAMTSSGPLLFLMYSVKRWKISLKPGA